MTEIFWLEQRADEVRGPDDWLAAAECQRLAALRFPKRREEWRLGRWTAKRAVAAFLGLPPTPEGLREIEIRTAPCGAPEVVLADRAAPVSISLSHRAGTGLCVIGPPEVIPGCDLETVEPRSSSFLEDYFTAEEQAVVGNAPAADRDRLITLLWSSKESVLKCLRVGLRSPTKSISVRPAQGGRQQNWETFDAWSDGGQMFQGWWRETGFLLRTLAIQHPGEGLYARLAEGLGGGGNQ